MINASLVVTVVVSVFLNIWLLLKIGSLKSKRGSYAQDARDLLHDLTKGRAVIKIEVLDPASIFLRSPGR